MDKFKRQFKPVSKHLNLIPEPGKIQDGLPKFFRFSRDAYLGTRIPLQETANDRIDRELFETDPNKLDAHAPGAKLDAGKPQAALLNQFSLALLEVAKVATFGAKKYSVGGWQHVDNGIARYSDALMRHWLEESFELNDSNSNLKHAAHLAWNALARLELMIREEKHE